MSLKYEPSSGQLHMWCSLPARQRYRPFTPNHQQGVHRDVRRDTLVALRVLPYEIGEEA